MNAQEIKYRVEEGMAPLAGRIRVSPNVVTCSALGVMILAGFSLTAGKPGWAGSLILFSGFLDILDGSVARATGRETRFGALLDRVFDRAADFTIISAVVLGGYVDLWLGLFVVSTVLLASYISACLEAATFSRVGEKLSLRAIRLGILALGCFSGRLREGMVLLAVVGSGAVAFRMGTAYRLLLPGDKTVSH